MRSYNKNRISVKYLWFISYITILIIPLLITGALFFCIERVVNRKIASMNESSLYQVKGTLDTMFESMYKSALQFQMSVETNNVLNSGEHLTSDDYYRLHEMREYIKRYTTYSDYVDDVVMVLEQSGYCISSKSSYGPELFTEMLHQYNLTIKEWDYLSSRSASGFYILEREPEQKSCVIFSAPLPAGATLKLKGRMLIIPKDRYFRQKVNWDSIHASKAVYLLNGENVMSLGDVPEWIDEEFVSTFKGTEGELYSYRDKKRLVSAINSDITDMKYIVVDQYSEVYRELKTIRWFLLGSITVSMILGIRLSYYFMKKNYVPIKKLIASIMGNTEVQKVQDTNEYVFLSNAITKVIDNKQEIEWQMSLIRLLRGHAVPVEARLAITASSYTVIVFSIEDTRGFLGEEEIEMDSHRLLSFVVSNCSRDFFDGTANVLDVVELDRYLVQILCFSKGSHHELRTEVWKSIEQLHKFFNDALKIKFSIALGEFCQRKEDISHSYETAREALEYRVVMGNNVLIDSHELTGFTMFYDYSIETEKDIINSLKHGNFEQSRDLAFRLIDRNLGSGMMSAQLAHCMLFDIVATVMKALSLTRLDSNFLGQLNPIERLFQCETFEQMKHELSDILWKVCEYISRDKEEPNKELFERVTDYVDGHFMEEDLNVGALANELFVSKTFLVKLFKDYTSLTPLDYISRLRCERASVLLRDSNRTVEEIAAKVGYASSHSFIRVFKKLYGKTPGAYRTVLIKEGLERKL